MIATLPEPLSRALDAELQQHDPTAIRNAATALSEAYRAQRGIARALSPVERAAYLAVRFPSTFAAASVVWGELARVCNLDAVRSVLDVGAGPGTASLASDGVLSDAKFSLLERDSGWRQIAGRLAQASAIDAAFRVGAVPGSIEPHDVVVAGYALNELTENERAAAVAELWTAARIALIVLEPGTPQGFSVCEAARTQTLAAGAHAAAPCTHSEHCPMSRADWCHQPVRLSRSASHRFAKRAALAYEDEKFSYVVLTRNPPRRLATARIVRKPIRNAGHVHLDLCDASGLNRLTVGRSDKEHYRDARAVEWGEAWPADQSGA